MGRNPITGGNHAGCILIILALAFCACIPPGYVMVERSGYDLMQHRLITYDQREREYLEHRGWEQRGDHPDFEAPIIPLPLPMPELPMPEYPGWFSTRIHPGWFSTTRSSLDPIHELDQSSILLSSKIAAIRANTIQWIGKVKLPTPPEWIVPKGECGMKQTCGSYWKNTNECEIRGCAVLHFPKYEQVDCHAPAGPAPKGQNNWWWD
jgi:hypothetical protein